MRRSDREIKDHDELVAIIKRCDVLRLGLVDGDYAYILPLNFGFEEANGEMKFYFHSALEGHKMDLIKEGTKASFEMDCSHQLIYKEEQGMCTMAYESIMGKGTLHILSEEEKFESLTKLMDQYYPGESKYFDPAAISRTCVYCLTVAELTGKKRKAK